MEPTLMTLALAAGLSVFTWSIVSKLRLFFRMAPENRFDQPWRRLGLLFRIGLGQSRLVARRRERSAGAMHFFIFWGFMVLALREVLLVGDAYHPGFAELLPLLNSGALTAYLYVFLYNVTEVVVFCMVLIALYRRLVLRPVRLDLNVEGIVILCLILGVVTTDMFYDAARFNLIQVFGHDLHYLKASAWGNEMTWAPFASLLAKGMAPWGEALNAMVLQFGYWLHIGIILVFLNLLPLGKHAHVISALPNVFFGSLGYPHTPATLLNLEDEEAWESGGLGVDRIEHLTWKQGLDLYTCTECGRCYDICPTYVTRKPLSLKWFNDQLRHHLEEQKGALLSTGASSGETPLVGGVIRNDTLWACTTCRACEEVCPVSIEHVPRIISMRQSQTLMHEQYPKELASTFRGLEQNGNPWNLGYDQRDGWTEDLDFPITVLSEPPEEEVDVVMWVGCMGAFDKRSQKITQAIAILLRKAGVRFAILGTKEKCTGDLARRTGNELLYQTLAGENVETLNALKVTQIVTQCPHCLNALKNEYPQLEGRYEVHHHSSYLAKLVDEGRLTLKPGLEGAVTFHDPCYLGRYNGEYDAPRALLAQSAQETPVEMERSRNESFCCGAGGGRMWLEENIGTRVNEERVRQAAQTGAKTIATACPFCMTMIEDALRQKGQEDDMKVKDIAEVVLDSLA